MDPDILQDWYEQYGDIHEFEVGGETYYFRELSINEINYIDSQSEWTEVEVEDAYVAMCVVYPEIDPSKIKAGYVSRLAEEIMLHSRSSIQGVEHLISEMEQARELAISDVTMTMKAFVLCAMPAYKEEELNQLTVKELSNKVILSEKVLTFNQGVNGIPSENGVRLIFAKVSEEQDQTTPEMSEELKRKLAKKVKAMESVETDFVSPELKNLDTDILAKMAGVPMSNDPIARKLMGG